MDNCEAMKERSTTLKTLESDFDTENCLQETNTMILSSEFFHRHRKRKIIIQTQNQNRPKRTEKIFSHPQMHPIVGVTQEQKKERCDKREGNRE